MKFFKSSAFGRVWYRLCASKVKTVADSWNFANRIWWFSAAARRPYREPDDAVGPVGEGESTGVEQSRLHLN